MLSYMLSISKVFFEEIGLVFDKCSYTVSHVPDLGMPQLTGFVATVNNSLFNHFFLSYFQPASQPAGDTKSEAGICLAICLSKRDF